MTELIRYDSLVCLADHVIDYSKSYYEKLGIINKHNKQIHTSVSDLNIQPYDVIFIKSDLFYENFQDLLQIKIPYHLITGRSDFEINWRPIRRLLATRNLITWVGNNLWKLSDNMMTIPIGFTEIDKPNSKIILSKKNKNNKEIEIVLTPTGNTHPERVNVKNIQFPNITSIQNRLDYFEYLNILEKSKYSICPRGNGPDTHRVYESIMMNSIPIVKSYILNSLFKEIGCIIIDDWADLEKKSLQEKKLNRAVLTFRYWKERIYNHQKYWEEKGTINEEN